MDDNEFWRIISLLDWEKTGDDDAVIRPAVKELAKKSAEAINISEAWKNVDPYVKSVLLIFSVLSALRLAAICLAHTFKERIG